MRLAVPAVVPRTRERYLLGGELLLDVGRVRLERDGREMPLPRLSFDLLVALARAAPEVMTYDALMAEVWPGLIVRPETISQRAKLLRDALGDDARHPRFVAGMRGRGYSLACRVERLAPSPLAPLVSLLQAPPEPRARPSRIPWRVALGIAAVLAAAVGIWALGAFTPAGFPSKPLLLVPFRDNGLAPGEARIAGHMTDAVRSLLEGRHGMDVEVAEPVPARLQLLAAWRPAARASRIEGEVRRAGDRIRVDARVLDGKDAIVTLLREAPATGLEALHEDLAQRIARGVRIEASARQAALKPDRGTGNAEARLEFERGLARHQRWRADDAGMAVAHFRRSIALDPRYARPHAWLAMAEQRVASYRQHELRALQPRLATLLARAKALDPDLGVAHAFSAFLAQDPVDAERGLREAVALDASSAESHVLLAELLRGKTGSEAEARAALDRAIALSPDTTRYRYLRAISLWADPETSAQAEAEMRNVIAQDPDFAPASARLARWVWLRQLQPAEAVPLSELAIRVDPDTAWPRSTLCRIYLDLDDPAAARDVAAGTEPDTMLACRMDLALFEGDWRGASRMALTAPTGVLQSGYFGAGLLGALDRYASERGDTEEILTLLRRTYGPRYDQVGADTPAMPERAYLLVRLYTLAGDTAARERVLQALGDWLPDAERSHPERDPYPTRAMLLAWSGEDDAALDALLDWSRGGHSPYWWYVFMHDPTWLGLRHDPRFLQAAEMERDYVARQRSLLAGHRSRGQVPMRPR